MHKSLFFLVFIWSTVAIATPNTHRFWSGWSDGKAEVSGYQLTQERYGETRTGHAVLIFVTEPFSRAQSVKVDRYNHQDPDHFIALKLNHIQRFKTGVYDYHLMTSVFTDPSQGFAPMKQSFASQEWCGLVHEEILWRGSKATVRVDSYFEGESGTTELKASSSEDALWVLARGLMAGGPGASMPPAAYVERAQHRRLIHRQASASRIDFEWSAPRKITVPAGRFSVRSLSWRNPRGECQLHVEIAAPHRVIGWQCSHGERAELTGTQRFPYWQTVRGDQRALLKALGLPAQ